jgi:hypothetical protein
LTSGPTFLAFHFCLACAAVATPFALRSVRRSPELRLVVATLLVGGAVPAILFSWVGSYDPVTLAAAAVAALARSRVVMFLAWAVFAFNDAPEAALALIVFAIVLLVDWQGARPRRARVVRRISVSGGGAVLGYLGIRVLTNAWGGASSEFTLVFHYFGFSRFLNSTLDYWPLIIVSALGVGWLFLADREIRNFAAARAMAALAVAMCVVFPFFVLDQSRVLATVLWPGILLTASLTLRRMSPDAARAVLGRMAPAALLLVVVLVWDNGLVYAGWRSIGLFLGYVFGHAPIPVSP